MMPVEDLDFNYDENNDNDDNPQNIPSSVSRTPENNRSPPVHQDSNVASIPKKKSGLFGASSNLVNSIVGAGIIGIPYAMKESGLIAGVFLLFLVAYMTDKSLRIIIEAASFHPILRNRGVTTFEDLMSYPFGRAGYNFVLVNMFIMAYGAMVAYLLIIKDTVPTILGFAHGMEGGIEREVILIITSVMIIIPLALQRDMASLAFTSLLSVTADVILVGFVAAYAPIKESVNEVGGFWQLVKQDGVNPTLFIGLGILSTAMACQHSAFIVYGSLLNGTRFRWARVTGVSIGISAILCALLGICGYIGFLDDTYGDVLNNFEAGSVAANGARFLLAITMFFTYPMESFVARHVLVALLFDGDLDGEGELAPENAFGKLFCGCNRRIRITLFIYLLALLPALVFDDLGPVLSITGAVGGSCVSYIAPGIVYLGVNGDTFLSYIKEYLANRNGVQQSPASMELPVIGDPDQVISASSQGGLELPVSGTQIDMVTSSTGPTPFWWCFLGFPIWCKIASIGSAGMRDKLSQGQASDPSSPDRFRALQSVPPVNVASDGQIEEIVVLPSGHDFCVSIFFIIFGMIALVAGLGTNIYVQVNNLYE